MFDLLGMVQNATASLGSRAIALAAPYEMSEHYCRSLVKDGTISSYLLSEVPRATHFDPAICGWWIDRPAGRWFLRSDTPRTLLLINARAEERLSGQMLLEARLKGVRNVILADIHGKILREVDTTKELIERVDNSISDPIYGAHEYDRIYDLIRSELQPALRLAPEDIIPGRIMLMIGSLGGGGAERQAAYTAAGLAQRGEDVVVGVNYIHPPHDIYKHTVERYGVPISVAPERHAEFETDQIRDFRSRLREFDNLAIQAICEQIFHYALMIRAQRPNLVHCWLDYGNVLGGIAAELVGVPYILVSGRNVAPDNFPNIFQPYMKPGYLWLYARRNLIFLNNSVAGARDYARWLGRAEADFRVVHNGFEFPDTNFNVNRDVVRKDLGFPADAFVIGTMVRFAEEKNPQLFVDTAALLYRRFPMMRFVAFGEGPLLAPQRGRVAALGLQEIIKLPGITRDAWGAMAALDVFLLASRMEGLPNVLVEAQASGLPVVATMVGGAPETFIDGKTGFGVKEHTPEALAIPIARLFQDRSLYSDISGAARSHAHQTFSIDYMIDKTLAAYSAAGF